MQGDIGRLPYDPCTGAERIVENFNGRQRDEPLALETFCSLAESKYLVDRWRHYNHRCPQRALGKRTPAEYAGRVPAALPLRLATPACAATPPAKGKPTSMLTLSQGAPRGARRWDLL